MGACCRMAATPALGRHTLRRRHTSRSNHAMEPRRWRRRNRKPKTGILLSNPQALDGWLTGWLCVLAVTQEGELLSRLRVEAGRRLVRAAAERSWPPPRS